ncbi:terpene synthase family protein [Streptomyces sp. NBC_00237]|uniref:terpene synthase family protein n=1 Tax=Streptomyces sp. NBC_00237 TaxID=2975687 RepID=UPI002258A589|nr:terpene synthase family protein [Streptomyces sp. NBC_00237]MCX5205569.1 terpene synthase family protein [Streptomyces sp. NBC_00237]
MKEDLHLADYAHTHLLRLFAPARPHPDAAVLEADVRGWVTATGLHRLVAEERLTTWQVGHLIGFCMPGAPLPVARLTARYLMWEFVFDDAVAEQDLLLRQYQSYDLPRLLGAGDRPPAVADDPLLDALARLRGEIMEAGGELLLPVLADGLRHYLAASARQSPWRSSEQPPCLGDYLRDRTSTAGGHPLYLQRLAPGMPAPGESLPPALTALAELAFLLGGLANDLLGYAIEQANGDPVNVVTVLAHEYALTRAEAYRAAVILHAGHKHRFDANAAALAADGRLTRQHHHFAEAVAGWVHGSAAAVEPYWQHTRTRSHL